jgi:hypothetical protein
MLNNMIKLFGIFIIYYIFFINNIICDDNKGLKYLEISTYNTALLPNYEYKQNVLNNIPRNLDLISLQEVWVESDANEIINLFKNDYPYSYYETPNAGEDVGCRNANSFNYLQQFGGCLAQNQITEIGWNSVKPCLHILDNWLNVDPICVQCVLSGQTNSDPLTLQKCFATNQGKLKTYNGSTGILLLSKKPLNKVKFTQKDSFLLRRGLLEFCYQDLYIVTSHFPFNYSIPLPQDYQQNFAHDVLKLRPNILFGDLNSGNDYQSQAYNILKNDGYKSINPNLSTFCTIPNNTICDGYASSSLSTTRDHIMYDNQIHPNRLNFVNTTNYNINIYGDDVNISDHLGLYSKLSYVLKKKHVYCQ